MIQGDPGSSLPEGPYLFVLGVALAALASTAATCRTGLDSLSAARLLHGLPEEAARERWARRLEARDRTRLALALVQAAAEALLAALLLLLSARLLASHDPFAAGPLLLAALLCAACVVPLCHVLPRSVARAVGEERFAALLPALHVLGLALSPLAAPFLGLARLLNSIAGRPDPAAADEAITDEIIATVAAGERKGVVGEEEADMIENVVELRAFEVSEVMTPRADISWVDADTPVYQALRVAAERRHSRLPVGEGDSDHIIGVFYIRDVVDRLTDIDAQNQPVREVCRKPYYVLEDKKVSRLLQEFRENRLHIAIVVDQYGATSGLITIEDILEEIVGEIDDEYDVSRKRRELKLLAPGHARVDARVHIDEVNEALGIALPESEDFDTVGGFVSSVLGRVPQAGETLVLEGVEIKVLEADERRVKRVEVRAVEQASGQEGADEA
ncbi:MAG: HlyC/CorC family transporter [Planctomycetes bacterium]|nr:HlyC/CorC family transporter [Planctomycetota bacterium]